MAAVHMKEKWIKYFDSLGGRNDRCLNVRLNIYSSTFSKLIIETLFYSGLAELLGRRVERTQGTSAGEVRMAFRKCS